MFNFQPKVNTEEIFNIREKQVWEASRLHGKPVYYLQAESIDADIIFGEEVSRNFDESKKHEFYATRDNDTFYSGEESFGGFGFLPQYADIVYVPVKWFKDLDIEPIEGDIVMYDKSDLNTVFEISKISPLTEEYNGDIVAGRRFNYKIYLKLYQRGDDTFSSFETETDDTSFLEEFEEVDLDNLNDDLTTKLDIDDNVKIDSRNPFGDLD